MAATTTRLARTNTEPSTSPHRPSDWHANADDVAPSRRRRAVAIRDTGIEHFRDSPDARRAKQLSAGAHIAGRLVGRGYLSLREAVEPYVHAALESGYITEALRARDLVASAVTEGTEDPLPLDEDILTCTAAALSAFDQGQAAPQHGIARHTRRKVLWAILWNMQIEGSKAVPVAIRSIAEDANISHVTAQKHIRGLINGGLLDEAAPANSRHARLVRVSDQLFPTTMPQEDGTSLVVQARENGSVNGFPDTQLPAWSHSELGETGRRIYSSLSDNPQSVAAITESSTVSKTTVYRKLSIMDQLGLAARTDDGWVVGHSSPESIANDSLQRRQRRHAIERYKRGTIDRRVAVAIVGGEEDLNQAVGRSLPSPENPCNCERCSAEPTRQRLDSLRAMRLSPEQQRASAQRRVAQLLSEKGWSEDAIADSLGDDSRILVTTARAA